MKLEVGSNSGFSVTNIIMIVLLIASVTFSTVQTLRINKIQQKYVEAELAKTLPIQGDIQAVEEQKTITLAEIEVRKAKLEQLEQELKRTSDTVMSVEEAIKILQK